MARCARMFAGMIIRIAHLLRGNARHHVIGFANVLENFAHTIEQPRQRKMCETQMHCSLPFFMEA